MVWGFFCLYFVASWACCSNGKCTASILAGYFYQLMSLSVRLSFLNEARSNLFCDLGSHSGVVGKRCGEEMWDTFGTVLGIF